MPRRKSTATTQPSSTRSASSRAATAKQAREQEAQTLTDIGIEQTLDAADDLQAAQDLASLQHIALAAGASDLTRGADLELVADRVARIGAIVGAAGAQDVVQGAELLAEADDIETMSAVVGVMSAADLERGMELARLSGEMQAAGRIVARLQLPVLAGWLVDRGGVLNDWAVGSILRASGGRALATALAVTGVEIAALSENEVAEGIVRLAASEALAQRSGELALAGMGAMAVGTEEVERAGTLGEMSRAAAGEGLAEATEGAVALGAAAEAAQILKE